MVMKSLKRSQSIPIKQQQQQQSLPIKQQQQQQQSHIPKPSKHEIGKELIIPKVPESPFPKPLSILPSELPEPVLVPTYVIPEETPASLPSLKKEVIKLRDEIMKRNDIEKRLNVYILLLFIGL